MTFMASVALAGLPAAPVEQWRFVFADHDPDRTSSDTVPIVVQLTDDNGDGVIDGSDSADVVFVMAHPSYSFTDMRLVAVHGTDGSPIFSIVGPIGTLGLGAVAGGLAGADISGDGAAEILVGDEARLYIYDAAGTLIRSLAWPHDRALLGHALNVADLNQDGALDVYDEASVISVDGSWSWHATPSNDDGGECAHSAALDLDTASPGLELFHWRTLHASDGSVLWENPDVAASAVAVADFDGDGRPELALYGNETLQMVAPTGESLGLSHAVNIDRSQPCASPIAADVDGDGRTELIVASESWLYSFSWEQGQWIEEWRTPVSDVSGAATSTAFDFDGDGAAEIVYRDELGWYIVDGRCGAILSFEVFPSDTGLEFPVVANIDSDPNAEILVTMRTGPSEWAMVLAYEVPGSCTPRATWHQFDYHVSNIDSDGHVPAAPTLPWQDGLGWRAQAPAAPRTLSGLRWATAAGESNGCTPGVRVTWDAVVTPSGGPAEYSVSLVEDGCCGESTATQLISGLVRTEWFDPDAFNAGPRTYLITGGEAGPPYCQRAVACSAAVTVGSGDLGPEDSGGLLYVRKSGGQLNIAWPNARILAAGEHFHLKQAIDSPQLPFVRVSPEGYTDYSIVTDALAGSAYFVVLVGDGCEMESAD